MEITIDSNASITPDATKGKQDTKPTDRPAWLPENFKTPEDLVKSYKESQAKISELTTKAPAKIVEEALKDKGLDAGAIADELAQNNGQLSPATYKALFEKGLSPEQVGAFVADVRSSQDAGANALYETAGGREEYAKVIEFAKTGVPKELAKAYNDAIRRSDVDTAKILLGNIKDSYVKANGTDAKRITDGAGAKPPASSNGDVFSSMDEYVAALQTTDMSNPAAVAKVEEKLGRSTFYKASYHQAGMAQ